MKKYEDLTDEIFREMMACDKGIRRAANVTPYGHFEMAGDGSRIITNDGYYVDWPDYRSKWEISEKQQNEASLLFEQRKAECISIAQQPGVLTWVSMGMPFEPTIPDVIGNHRIRTDIADSLGRIFLIELHPSKSKGWWGDVYHTSENEEREKEYLCRREAAIAKYGSFFKIPIGELPVQPSSIHEVVSSSDDFTFANVLSWVNSKFGTTFREMHLDEHILSCGDYVSKCN